MILNTQAIALRIRPFSRTSHVVTWLSPDHGRVTTVVKGACRPKSAFLGQYDLFVTCELLFYRREHDGLHAIRECCPLARSDGLRGDWRRVSAAGYCADLAARALPPGQEAVGAYALLAATLDRLADGPAQDAESLLVYELALLRHLGLEPQLAPCPACGPDAAPWRRFGLAAGRVACPHRGGAAPGETAVTVHRDALERLRLLAASAAGGPPLPACPSHVSLGARRLLGIFMRFHLDLPPAPRRVAFELVEADPAAGAAGTGDLQ